MQILKVKLSENEIELIFKLLTVSFDTDTASQSGHTVNFNIGLNLAVVFVTLINSSG